MGKLPETDSSLVRYLGRQKRQAQRQSQSSAYVRSGISLISEGVASVDGQIQSGDFNGIDRTHLGSAGWMLGWADGQPSMLVLNGIDVYADLTTKTASLAALVADTVRAGQAGTWVVNFPVPTAVTPVASRTIAVPAGFSNAFIFATAHASVKNTTAGNDYFYVGASINGVMPATMLAPAKTNDYATSSGSATRLVTGLSGGVITVETMVHSSFGAFAAIASNIASIDAFALFYR